MTGAEVDEGDDELSVMRAERDALRRDLGDLRAHLCVTLGILHHEPGPGGLDVLSVVSDKEILDAVRQLSVDAVSPTSSDENRWTAIDRLILDGRRIPAIQGIREEFGGGIHEALDMLVRRYDRLRADRPNEFAQDHENYWRNFYS